MRVRRRPLFRRAKHLDLCAGKHSPCLRPRRGRRSLRLSPPRNDKAVGPDRQRHHFDERYRGRPRRGTLFDLRRRSCRSIYPRTIPFLVTPRGFGRLQEGRADRW
jgi:hypothetical protein